MDHKIMEAPEHYKNLERMYNSAPINKMIQCSLKISKEHATVILDIKSDFYHAANAVHGSLYFKVLDDSAYFAVNSTELEFFVLTTQLRKSGITI